MGWQAIDNFSPVANAREKRPHIPALFESAAPPHEIKKETKEMDKKSDDAHLNPNRRMAFYQETATGTEGSDPPEENSRSIWFGQLRQEAGSNQVNASDVSDADVKVQVKEEPVDGPRSPNPEEQRSTALNVDYLSTLPARQRQLFRRIQQQQREPASSEGEPTNERDPNEGMKWQYSSDEEDDLIKPIKQEIPAPAALPALNFSSLENINVADIAKALSTLQGSADGGSSDRRDPRTRDPRMRMGDVDLRLRHQDVDLRLDVDLRKTSIPPAAVVANNLEDVDLRRRFPTPHYSPEIEASITKCPPIDYQVYVVDVVPLDYGLIRVQSDWAHLDPRQQKYNVGTRDFTSTDPPAIPLGPASPDPVPHTTGSSSFNRHYDMIDPTPPAVYSPLRPAPNDPRARDPRRGNAGPPQQQQLPSVGGTISGVGLLGAAPPGMLPILSKTMDPSGGLGQDMGSFHYRQQGGASSYGEEPRQVENRRDPRQRLKNPLPNATHVDNPERSYTPPMNERVFR